MVRRFAPCRSAETVIHRGAASGNAEQANPAVEADRFGRRTLLLITVGGFAIASAATAFVQTKLQFTIWQTAARLFLKIIPAVSAPST